jgi:hypothetical protein
VRKTHAHTIGADAWHPIMKALERSRGAHDQLKMFAALMSGEQMFGLTEAAISKMIESVWFAAGVLWHAHTHSCPASTRYSHTHSSTVECH